MEQFYLATDAILLLASDLPSRAKLIEQLDTTLQSSGLVTSSYSLLETNRIFGEKKASLQFRTFLWTIRPLFDAVLNFTEEELERATALMDSSAIPMRHAIEGSFVLNHGLAGILSSSPKFDWIPALRRIPVSV